VHGGEDGNTAVVTRGYPQVQCNDSWLAGPVWEPISGGALIWDRSRDPGWSTACRRTHCS